MKNLIIMFSVILLTQQLTQAQGTVYLSNLGQASTGSFSVGSDSWLATDFYTGNNAGGYLLVSVQLAMADASGNPSGFTVMIYSAVGPAGPIPGSSLGTLTGSLSPISAGTYTYTPTSSLILSPSTAYFIVLSAGTTVADGAYAWERAYPSTSYNPNGNWDGGGYEFRTSSGSLGSWGYLGEYYPQYAITATPVPEPSSFSLWLAGIGGIASVLFFKNRRKYFL